MSSLLPLIVVNLDCAASVTAGEKATAGSECAPDPIAMDEDISSAHRYATKHGTPKRFGASATSSQAPAPSILSVISAHHASSTVPRSTHTRSYTGTFDMLSVASRSIISYRLCITASCRVLPAAKPLEEALGLPSSQSSRE